MSSMKMFPILLKKYRQNAGMTQKEVAEAVGLALYSYKCYEAGRRTPNLEMASKLASIFGCTVDELIGK